MASSDKDRLMADLSAHLDGELSLERAREVERFLSKSEEARRTLAELRAISRGLGDLPRMRAPEGLVEKVRRSAERQVLLPKRPPAGRARVVKLFARISASAAVIAACVIAGWTVLERTSAPPRTETSDELAAGGPRPTDSDRAVNAGRRLLPAEAASAEVVIANAAEAPAEAPAIAMKDTIKALYTRDYDADSEIEALHALDYDADSEPECEIAMAPKEAAAEVETATVEPKAALARGGLAPLEEGAAAPSQPPVTDVMPIVNVIVRPRDASEYNDTLQTVALWQAPPSVGGGRFVGAGRAAESRRSGQRGTKMVAETGLVSAPTAFTQQDFVLEVPAARFNEVLLSFDRQAPGQVLAAVNFNVRDISQVQRMVTPTGTRLPEADLRFAAEQPAPAESPRAFARTETPAGERGVAPGEPGAFAARRAGGGGALRGHVVRSPPTPKMGVPAEAEEAAGKRAAAYRAREALDADALQRLPAPSYVAGADVADGLGEQSAGNESALTDAKKASADQRHPRVEDVAAGVPARLRAPPAGDKLDIAERPGPDKAGALHSPKFLADAASAVPPPAPVTLRVTLLPPPSAPATQAAPSAPRPEAP